MNILISCGGEWGSGVVGAILTAKPLCGFLRLAGYKDEQDKALNVVGPTGERERESWGSWSAHTMGEWVLVFAKREETWQATDCTHAMRTNSPPARLALAAGSTLYPMWWNPTRCPSIRRSSYSFSVRASICWRYSTDERTTGVSVPLRY